MKRIVWAIDGKMHPKEFIDNGIRYENKIHSIKINSLYHFLLTKHNNVLDSYYEQTTTPLFADFKLYDTPKTVAETISNLHRAFKFCTVVHNDNLESLVHGTEVALTKDVLIFAVWKLTSSLPSILTYELKEEFTNWCYEVSGAVGADNVGVVVPYYLLPYVKRFGFKALLTPGVYVDKPNNGQCATVSIRDVVKYEPDLLVLGRSFGEYDKTRRL